MNYHIKQEVLNTRKQIGIFLIVKPVLSENNDDDRSYNVSADKIKQVGFTASKTLKDGINEIKDAFTNKIIKDFNDVKYNNYKFLYSSKEIQKEVFIEGISGSLDIP